MFTNPCPPAGPGNQRPGLRGDRRCPRCRPGCRDDDRELQHLCWLAERFLGICHLLGSQDEFRAHLLLACPGDCRRVGVGVDRVRQGGSQQGEFCTANHLLRVCEGACSGLEAVMHLPE